MVVILLRNAAAIVYSMQILNIDFNILLYTPHQFYCFVSLSFIHFLMLIHLSDIN